MSSYLQLLLCPSSLAQVKQIKQGKTDPDLKELAALQKQLGAGGGSWLHGLSRDGFLGHLNDVEVVHVEMLMVSTMRASCAR